MRRRNLIAPAATAMLMTAIPIAPAQNVWQGDTPARAEARRNQPAGKTADVALSPNRIVGRVLWADSAKKLCVIRLDGLPEPAGTPLVARSADCAPHAILAPVPTAGRRGATAGYRVQQGQVAVGMEVVQPGKDLLKTAKTRIARTSSATVTGSVPPNAPTSSRSPAPL